VKTWPLNRFFLACRLKNWFHQPGTCQHYRHGT